MNNLISKSLASMMPLIASVLPFSTFAYVDGEVYSRNGSPYEFNIRIDNGSFPNNTEGASFSHSYSQAATYKVNCYNSQNYAIKAPIFYTTKSDLPVDSDGGYTLSEYIRVAASVYVAGALRQYVEAPFENKSNEGTSVCPANGGKVSDGNGNDMNLGTGSQGKFIFYLKKPIVNGVSITGVHVLDIKGRVGNQTSSIPDSVLARVYIESFIVTVADKCVVNEGTPIQVEFGLIPNSALTGDKYVKNVPVEVKCEGGSFAQGNVSLNIAVQPGTGITSFNSNLLATDKQDLGISLKRKNDGMTIVPAQFYSLDNFDLDTLRGEWDLVAAPVNRPGTSLTEGEFNSSSTIVLEFQ